MSNLKILRHQMYGYYHFYNLQLTLNVCIKFYVGGQILFYLPNKEI